MPTIFPELIYFERVAPMDGAMQMAIDELLLQHSDGVRLRDYEWIEPCVSLGYFGIHSQAQAALDGKRSKSIVRRPTGGGMVEHGHGMDFTYSIVVGAAEMGRSELSPRGSYRSIHGLLAGVLQSFGVPVTIASGDERGDGGLACFVNPVADDVLLGGIKVAGAGQKRSRGALLHQGSVQPVKLPAEFGLAFANALAERVVRQTLNPQLLAQAEVLAEEKYRSVPWNRRR